MHILAIFVLLLQNGGMAKSLKQLCDVKCLRTKMPSLHTVLILLRDQVDRSLLNAPALSHAEEMQNLSLTGYV